MQKRDIKSPVAANLMWLSPGVYGLSMPTHWDGGGRLFLQRAK